MILDVMLINGSFLYNNPYLSGNDKAGRIAHSSTHQGVKKCLRAYGINLNWSN
jgi:hypothetical protein